MIKFQADDCFWSAVLIKIALLRRSLSCFKMRLIVPKHKKVHDVSGSRDENVWWARQLGISLQEDTIYTRIKYLARFRSYLNLIQSMLHKGISLAFSIFRVFSFQHVCTLCILKFTTPGPSASKLFLCTIKYFCSNN